MTVDEIIAKMRKEAEEDESTPDGILGQTLFYLADQLERAIKEERGKCQIVTAKWKADYEYEYAQCSNCGHMQFADWDSHAEQAEKVGDFHKEYKFCPNCGAKMEGAENAD